MELEVLKNYRDLDLWKRAHAVVSEVYRLTNFFPRNEQFGVVSQLRRAAFSIPANIAEGYGRRSTKELIPFLAIANGSLEELRCFLLLSKDLRYLSVEAQETLEKDLKAVAQMMEALRKSLRLRLTLTSTAGRSRFSRDTEHGSRATEN